ncbi:hypothetical protein BDV96DRAFT_585417 [Lophiotrema nucula]|uniref:Uncharacterized protein n=1 Tax=Lophiotrema nucula TaxID=690887 RepID=A0A6A5YQR2_9PLEO|nr:hypothetical protein BDV96DRAFT_585417 [Lophiotrema nucula]
MLGVNRALRAELLSLLFRNTLIRMSYMVPTRSAHKSAWYQCESATVSEINPKPSSQSFRTTFLPTSVFPFLTSIVLAREVCGRSDGPQYALSLSDQQESKESTLDGQTNTLMFIARHCASLKSFHIEPCLRGTKDDVSCSQSEMGPNESRIEILQAALMGVIYKCHHLETLTLSRGEHVQLIDPTLPDTLDSRDFHEDEYLCLTGHSGHVREELAEKWISRTLTDFSQCRTLET